MSAGRCQFCGSVLYGCSDKRYCSSTCRRDACRVRTRTVRLGDYKFEGSELSRSFSIERYLIPKLQRQYGPNHRVVQDARLHARNLEEAALEQLAEKMRVLAERWRAQP